MAALLHELVRCQEAIRVVLEDGKTVEIRPLNRLDPLPVREGFVPVGWRDATYAQ